MILFTITSGWTGRVGPFTLIRNAQPFSLSGFAVEMVVHDERGLPVALGGTLTSSGGALTTGQVVYDPGVNDFLNSRRHAIAYRMHFKVTDSLGKVVFFPNGKAYDIVIAPQ